MTKALTVGKPVIQILADKGEWVSASGELAMIAASDLFNNDPYKEIERLVTYAQHLERENERLRRTPDLMVTTDEWTYVWTNGESGRKGVLGFVQPKDSDCGSVAGGGAPSGAGRAPIQAHDREGLAMDGGLEPIYESDTPPELYRKMKALDGRMRDLETRFHDLMLSRVKGGSDGHT